MPLDTPRSTVCAPPGAFGLAALDLVAQGLVPIPLGGPDGKKPLATGWQKWRVGAEAASRNPDLVRKFGPANIGVATGLLVVDIDDTMLVDAVLERFGPTPIQVGTRRGGTTVVGSVSV